MYAIQAETSLNRASTKALLYNCTTRMVRLGCSTECYGWLTLKFFAEHLDNLNEVAVATCLATCQLQNEAHFCGDLGTADNFS